MNSAHLVAAEQPSGRAGLRATRELRKRDR